VPVKWWLPIAVLVAFGACDVCACTPPPITAQVVGFVRDTTGAPLSATVTAAMRERTCTVSAPGLGGNIAAATDSAGRYHLDVWTFAPDTVCVRLVARRTGAPDSTVRDGLLLPITGGDTLRVDFEFP
jgi:hypothetical protein